MQVTSQCPRCQCSFNWLMNQKERTPDGGYCPAKSPNCPKCGYDITGTNERAIRNFHYFAKTDDIDSMREILLKPQDEKKRLLQVYEKQKQKYDKAKNNFKPSLKNLFGILKPNAPEPPILPDIPDVNAKVEGNTFNPLIVAAIYGSEKAAKFLLDNGINEAEIPLAIEKAKEFGHNKIIEILKRSNP